MEHPEDDCLDDHHVQNLRAKCVGDDRFREIYNLLGAEFKCDETSLIIKTPNVVLQHISVCASKPTLQRYNYNILHAVWKIVRNMNFQVRVGSDSYRKCFNIENIVKHIAYWKLNKSLCREEYFHFIKINPQPFCPKCGFARKTVESWCMCQLCRLLRVGMYYNTKIIELYSHDSTSTCGVPDPSSTHHSILAPSINTQKNQMTVIKMIFKINSKIPTAKRKLHCI